MNAPDGALKLPGGADPERFINFMVAVMPPTAAILAMLTSLLNLWLAGRVVKFSGRLTRPWPRTLGHALSAFAGDRARARDRAEFRRWAARDCRAAWSPPAC